MLESVKKYIISQVANRSMSPEEAKTMLLELEDCKKNERMDIAVIGMAGRFPKSQNLDEFWKNITNGVNCISDVPKERIDDIINILKTKSFSELIYGNTFENEDLTKIFVKSGYLDEIDKFDSQFFNIPPNEAMNMDPCHRNALEVAWLAMEEAGYGGDALVGSKTGIYFGKEGTNYSFYKCTSDPNPMLLTGTWESLMISRISYLYDFKGPCIMVDTACSAGLVSVHLAVQALQSGECDLALAGGINISLTGELKSGSSKINLDNIENGDGLVKTFDKSSNGTVWGEGVGMVLLKPLQQALKDGDHIHAIIKGSAINNDGHSSSMTAPDADSQKKVILEAWEKAGIAPENISYMEAHGTGTILGDPIETQGLKEAFKKYTARKQFCAIGSLKTNMGHMVGASGIASLLKVIMSVENKKIPPMINFNMPNPYIDFVEGPLYISNRLKEWETDGAPRIGALSSFGFSRTNCHMVVEQAPQTQKGQDSQKYYCLTISARAQDLMEEYIRNYCDFVEKKEWNLQDLCYTSNVGRGHYEYRTIIIASNEAELKERLVKASLDNYSDGDGIYKGKYQITSDKKDYREEGDITRVEISKLSEKASAILEDYRKNGADDIEILKSLCMAYCKGAGIDWKKYYQGEERKRISAPVYPLRRTRYWAPIKESKFDISNEILHPLVEKRLGEDNVEIRYETLLRLDKHWVLSDHHVNHTAVVPGTTYLEMLRFVVQNETGASALEFRNVFFLIPLSVKDSCRIEIALQPQKDGYKFRVSSVSDGQHKVTHVQGEVYGIPQINKKADFEIENYKATAASFTEYTFSPDETEGFYFGPHWDGIRKSWDNEDDSLVELYLLNGLEDEVELYKLHPSLLDNAVNFKSQDRGVMYLPFMYKSIKVYGALTKKFYSHVKVNKELPYSKETMTYDIDLTDPEGNVLAEIKEYTVKEVKNVDSIGSSMQEKNCFKAVWIPADKDRQRSEKTQERWAVIAGKGARADELIRALKENQGVADLFEIGIAEGADPEEDIQRILGEMAKADYSAVLFAADYTAESVEYLNLLNEENATEKYRAAGVDYLFRFCKEFGKAKIRSVKRICVLTKDSVYADGSESCYSPFGAASSGITKVFHDENRKLDVTIVDVAGNMKAEEFVDGLVMAKGYLAIRKTGIYMQYLQAEYRPLDQKISLEAQGTYIVTGGLGGVGFEVAEHIADKTDATIVLVGRRTLKEEKLWEELANMQSSEAEIYKRLVQLRKKAAHLEYVSADVSKRDDMDNLCRYMKEKYREVNGIFHAAGVAGEGFIFNKSFEKYSGVMTPKLNGSVHILRAAKEFGKCFVFLFSSITALMGGEGQSDYCAANSFLDTLAELARTGGDNVISVNWPIWNEIGMSKDFAVDKDGVIFTSIEPEEGMSWLEYMISHPDRMIVPSKLNEKKLDEFADAFLFKLDVDASKGTQGKSTGNVKSAGRVVKVKGIQNPTKVHNNLANALGNLLGLDEVDVYTSFSDLGGNSLMSTQYLEAIEEVYPDIVHISDIFSYPSLIELAEYIEEQLPQEEKAQEENDENDTVKAGELGDIMELLKGELEDTEMMKEFMDELNK